MKLTKQNRFIPTFHSECCFWIIPAVLAGLCYFNGLPGDFVHDDVFAIKTNADSLGKAPLSEVFRNDFWGKPMSSNKSHKSYRPFTILTFRSNYYFTGLNPYYFHVVNVLLHVIVTAMFTVTCHSVFRLPRTCSMIAGALFAVHPIHTEAVTGIVGRADILAALFFLLSLLSYTKSLHCLPRDFPTIKYPCLFLCSLLSASAAVLCKETGITVLGVCLLYDVGVVCRGGVNRLLNGGQVSFQSCRPLVARILLLMTFMALVLYFRIWIMNGSLPKFIYQDNPASFQNELQTRVLSYGYLWAYNFWLLLFPGNLCYDWQNGSIPLVYSFADVRNLATASAAILLCACLFKCMHNIRVRAFDLKPDPIFVCVILMIVPFLPASNVFLRVGFVIAERVLYIPSMGYCLCVAVGVHKISTRWRYHRTIPFVVCCLMVMLHAGKTWHRNKDWLSREALFRSGINGMPNNSKVHYNYANYLKDSGQHNKAILHYRHTLRLDNSYASAHNNIGTLLKNKTQAEAHFREALRLVPLHQGTHINLGNILFKRGDKQEGMRYLYKAVEIDYRNPDALTSMGWSLMETERMTEAEHYLVLALDVSPDSFDANVHMASLMNKTGRHDKSAHYFRRAYELDSSHTDTLVHAAYAYRQTGDFIEAEHLLNRAVHIQRDARTLEQLAMVYFRTGRKDASLSLYEEINTLSANDTATLLRHAKVLASSDKFIEAERVLLQIIPNADGNIEVFHTIGQVSNNLGKYDQAVVYLTMGISLGLHTSHVDLGVIYFDRANAYKELKQYVEALEDYNATIELLPNHSNAHANAGTIYHINGDINKARYHYTESLRLEPGNIIVQRNVEKLDRLQIQRDRGIG